MEINYDEIRKYKDRIRIFLIIYFFAKEYEDNEFQDCCKVLYTEVLIQKLDFLLRNPDYLAYELLELVSDGNANKEDVRNIIKEIFTQREPEIRRLEMEKFFFGAYENIDEVIAFLMSIDFIKFESKRDKKLRVTNKAYYITNKADEAVKKHLSNMDAIKWYAKRCELIKKYFGDFTGSELKALQYKIDDYKNTSYNEYISEIQELVLEKYYEEYGEKI
jgi:hypothetical protein